jgi:hypothetical protein
MPRTVTDRDALSTRERANRDDSQQPLETRISTSVAFSRIDVAAMGMAAGLTWWSFAHLARQVVVGANPHEIASQALEGTALGVAWLLAVGAIAIMAITRTNPSPMNVGLRERAMSPWPPRSTGSPSRRRYGSADSDCTSRHPTTGCVPVGQYSSNSSRRAA